MNVPLIAPQVLDTFEWMLKSTGVKSESAPPAVLSEEAFLETAMTLARSSRDPGAYDLPDILESLKDEPERAKNLIWNHHHLFINLVRAYRRRHSR